MSNNGKNYNAHPQWERFLQALKNGALDLALTLAKIIEGELR